MIKKTDIEYIKKEFQKIHNFFISRQFEKVIEKTKILLKKDSSQVTFYNYIGLSYRELGRGEEAKEIIMRGLKMYPNNPSLLVNLGSVYRMLQEFTEAENILNKALDLNPNNYTALCNLGNIKRDLNKNQDAIKLYERAYNLDNKNVTLLLNLAGIYQTINDFEKSEKILRELQIIAPQNTIVDKMYSSIHKYSDNDEHQKLMINKEKNSQIPNGAKINLYFAIAKSFSDQKNHKKSSEYFVKGNNEKRKTLLNYHTGNERKLFQLIYDKFKNFNFENVKTKEEPNLIFIVGLPRSGTTLLHQIVSSHSKVFGAGELPIMRTKLLKVGKISPDALKILNSDYFDIFFNDDKYRKKLSEEIMTEFKLHHEKLIILDKSPLNFQWIGFIKLLFPNAKIIHSKRNLKDTALSIYRNIFEENNMPWSYHQNELVEFINIYKDFMKFWHSKIPNFIYDSSYENLVNNQIEETKKIIEFCNLEWDENCINYTENDTGIKTISISQARKPMYKSSVNLSDFYKDSLEFLNKISE